MRVSIYIKLSDRYVGSNTVATKSYKLWRFNLIVQQEVINFLTQKNIFCLLINQDAFSFSVLLCWPWFTWNRKNTSSFSFIEDTVMMQLPVIFRCLLFVANCSIKTQLVFVLCPISSALKFSTLWPHIIYFIRHPGLDLWRFWRLWTRMSFYFYWMKTLKNEYDSDTVTVLNACLVAVGQ